MDKNNEELINMLGEILGIDDPEENISLESNLVDDLGAESIDFIDICFQLEKGFKIGKVVSKDIFPEKLRSDADYDEEVLDEVVKQYPYLQGELVEEMKSKKNYTAILTVKAICKFVEWRLQNAK
ncbi:acyl carrier protein [Clostridium felsineum]|uniref:Acyl carrier protein n=1 Tax=Clostridium felsineum TaxID=36839 RepID=A0A1S8KZY5_9CLOT|nr:phosphopantetheine-binding protein [Clostridium felsineum]MCR3759265.1 hypothetical protein [Clostridium felsineum]URZ06409.1 Acyl carrier protein [Clostridium felsineum]URZ11444.1 Acyl carrier protein [Clostridium felsineum]URZ16105.1 Acyl carrier protein [Clostridium felsineum DSM 794]